MEPFPLAEGILAFHHLPVGAAPTVTVLGFGAVVQPLLIVLIVLLLLLLVVLLLFLF